MSDEPAEGSETPATPGTKPPKVVLGLLAVNLGLSAFILLKVMGGGATTAHAAPAHAAEPARREVVGPLVTLDPFVVNLNEPGSPRYLKIQLQVELLDGAAVKTFEKSKTLVRDDLLSYLSGLTMAETLGAENKNHIRGELESRVGELVGEGRVRRIVFADFVVQ